MKDLHQAIKHLQSDHALNLLIQKYGTIDYPPSQDIFASLASSIIGQQLSNKAADTIWNRFVTLFPDKKVTPHALKDLDSEQIRSVGTSWAKVAALKDLSEKTLNNTIQLNKLSEMTDDEIINHLIQVKGIGKWTAQMRLMFSLARPNILPLDDIGIQNAFVKNFKLKKTDPKLKQKMQKIAKSWEPYRTVACWYLWRSLDN